MDVTNDSSSRGNVKKPKAKSKWKKRDARLHNVTQEEEEMDELKNRKRVYLSLLRDSCYTCRWETVNCTDGPICSSLFLNSFPPC